MPELNLNVPTTIILAVIQGVKTTIKHGIHYHKELSIDKVVDLTTVECVVGRIQDRGEWVIVDQSDNIAIQVD